MICASSTGVAVTSQTRCPASRCRCASSRRAAGRSCRPSARRRSPRRVRRSRRPAGRRRTPARPPGPSEVSSASSPTIRNLTCSSANRTRSPVVKKFRATRPRAKWKIEAPCIIVLSTSKNAAAVRSAPGAQRRFVLVHGQVGGLGGGCAGDLRGLRLLAEASAPCDLLHPRLPDRRPRLRRPSHGCAVDRRAPAPGARSDYPPIRPPFAGLALAARRPGALSGCPLGPVNENGRVSSPGAGDIGIPAYPGTNVADLLRGRGSATSGPAGGDRAGRQQDLGRAGRGRRRGRRRPSRARRWRRASGWSSRCRAAPTSRWPCSPSPGPG